MRNESREEALMSYGSGLSGCPIALPAHNGLVAGSSPAGPTNEIRDLWMVPPKPRKCRHSYHHRFARWPFTLRAKARVEATGIPEHAADSRLRSQYMDVDEAVCAAEIEFRKSEIYLRDVSREAMRAITGFRSGLNLRNRMLRIVAALHCERRFRKPSLYPAELRDRFDIASRYLEQFGFCSDFAPLRKPLEPSF